MNTVLRKLSAPVKKTTQQLVEEDEEGIKANAELSAKYKNLYPIIEELFFLKTFESVTTVSNLRMDLPERQRKNKTRKMPSYILSHLTNYSIIKTTKEKIKNPDMDVERYIVQKTYQDEEEEVKNVIEEYFTFYDSKYRYFVRPKHLKEFTMGELSFDKGWRAPFILNNKWVLSKSTHQSYVVESKGEFSKYQIKTITKSMAERNKAAKRRQDKQKSLKLPRKRLRKSAKTDI